MKQTAEHDHDPIECFHESHGVEVWLFERDGHFYCNNCYSIVPGLIVGCQESCFPATCPGCFFKIGRAVCQ